MKEKLSRIKGLRFSRLKELNFRKLKEVNYRELPVTTARKLSQLSLRDILELRFRISAQLYLAIGGAVAMTVAACLVGWISFNQVAAAQTRVTDGSVPELAAAFGVAQYSGELVAGAAELSVADTIDEVNTVNNKISYANDLFNEQLDVLESRGGEGERLERIHTYSSALINNIAGINNSIYSGFTLTDRLAMIGTELEELRFNLNGIIVEEMDNQLFFTVTGFQELDEPKLGRDEHLSEPQLERYRHLAELRSNANIATQLLSSAATVTEPSLIEPLRERFESSAHHIQSNLFQLRGTPLHDELAPQFDRLLELGLADDNGFSVRARQLAIAERQQLLLENNQLIAILLIDEVDALVDGAELGAQVATDASSQSIFTGRILLIAITLISIGGGLMIAWLFVGRVLLRRLELLSGWMRRMAGGDLDTEVDIGGRDEVADMAAALEVFRRHAQEAIRLNLVEQLAEELEGKNAELEGINAELDGKNHQLEEVLANLTAAQDRIVAQEKLASLGQLTAGVAHEIRNPLNFVKNFSESSEELLDEMRETLEENEDGHLDDEQKDLIQDIFSDLTENLERIRMHGDRANRIVQDMLLMGRESVTHQMSSINNLLDEHARLAYHSARALDSDFQLDLQYDFEEMDDVNVNPRDIGRVFLNMVSNACYATDEKRRKLMEASGENGYMPTLLLTTRLKDDHVEVRIRDNGSGMPADIIEQIFNPFFTTKPTGQGTGLGLSICNDIIREHGGTIEVESAPGEFTEMVIGLPLEAPQVPELHLDDIEDDIEAEPVGGVSREGQDD